MLDILPALNAKTTGSQIIKRYGTWLNNIVDNVFWIENNAE
jgi:hypothetical protein